MRTGALLLEAISGRTKEWALPWSFSNAVMAKWPTACTAATGEARLRTNAARRRPALYVVNLPVSNEFSWPRCPSLRRKSKTPAIIERFGLMLSHLDRKLWRDLGRMKTRQWPSLVMGCGLAMMIVARSLIIRSNRPARILRANRFAEEFVQLKRLPRHRARVGELRRVVAVQAGSRFR
jgi:hypothetical protein